MYSVVVRRKIRHFLNVVFLFSLLLGGCERRTSYDYGTPWTVELKSAGIKVVLKAPFGTFKIWHQADIDYVSLTARGLDSMTMVWNYESGMPYGLWASLPENKEKKNMHISSYVSPVANGDSYAQIKKEVYFDRVKESPNPPIEIGLVWSNTVVKYENFNTTWYVINERTDLDGLLITCRNSAHYCRLRGAR